MSDCVILGIVAAVASTLCALAAALVAIVTVRGAQHQAKDLDPDEAFEVRPAKED